MNRAWSLLAPLPITGSRPGGWRRIVLRKAGGKDRVLSEAGRTEMAIDSCQARCPRDVMELKFTMLQDSIWRLWRRRAWRRGWDRQGKAGQFPLCRCSMPVLYAPCSCFVPACAYSCTWTCAPRTGGVDVQYLYCPF